MSQVVLNGDNFHKECFSAMKTEREQAAIDRWNSGFGQRLRHKKRAREMSDELTRVEKLIAELASDDSELATRAFLALSAAIASAPAAVLNGLQRLALRPGAGTRMIYVVTLLERLGNDARQILRAVFESSKDDMLRIRSAAALLAIGHGDNLVLDCLCHQLRRVPGTRNAALAAEAIGRLGADAIPYLRPHLRHSERYARVAVARQLWRAGCRDDDVREALSSALRDAENCEACEQRKSEVLYYLGILKDLRFTSNELTECVIALSRSGDEDLRHEAVGALAWICPFAPAVLRAVYDRLGDEWAAVRGAAAQTMVSFGENGTTELQRLIDAASVERNLAAYRAMDDAIRAVSLIQ